MAHRRRRRRFIRTSPEGTEIRHTAFMAYKRSPHGVVIGPHGEPLYGAAAAAYVHHRGHKRGVPYSIPRYGTAESKRRWADVRERETRHARSR